MKTKHAASRRAIKADGAPEEQYEQMLFQVVHKGVLIVALLFFALAIAADCLFRTFGSFS